MIDYPNPGGEFVIREFLGGGYWKRVFRASIYSSLNDVALLYYHDHTKLAVGEMVKEVANLINASQTSEDANYLAEFKGLRIGDDKRAFIVEELLDRPLNKYAPLHDPVRFARIARDLCRGLRCLHHMEYVHRDLKLDNCGVDKTGRAKLFDLGSAVSEPGAVSGTILTRAPELFEAALPADFSSHADVWGMGATLFALRTGEYPFVYPEEMRDRRRINADVGKGYISRKEADEQKREIDGSVRKRILADDADRYLAKRLSIVIKDPIAREILSSMLARDPSERIDASDAAEAWSNVAKDRGSGGYASPSVRHTDKELAVYLDSILSGEIVITHRQFDRINTMVQQSATVSSVTKAKINKTLLKIKEGIVYGR